MRMSRVPIATLVLALAASCQDAPTQPRVAPPAAPVSPGSGPRFPPDWRFPQGAPAPRSAKGMVCTDAALASKVGAQVLAEGGNAVDAAVATAFAEAVVYPTAGNLGGGGFLVARV